MDAFKAYMLKKAYERYRKLGDKLAQIEPLIDWEAFRSIIASLYHNHGPQGGRPNIDKVIMMKLLVLQSWYGLSDPELERQVADRISFRRFLRYPDPSRTPQRCGSSGNALQRQPRQTDLGGAAAPSQRERP